MTGLASAGRVTRPEHAPGFGWLVTNHLNLMSMLSAGLVMPPDGFGRKYYSDTLGAFPGWVPLFVGGVPSAAIEESFREARHLMPCIVKVRLDDISGPTWATSSMLGGGLDSRMFPSAFDGRVAGVLVPAPLPTARFEEVVFRSARERNECLLHSEDRSNVPVRDYRLVANRKSLFANAVPSAWWPFRDGPPPRSVDVEGPLGLGGVMAMLLCFGNLGDRAARACRGVFDPGSVPPTIGEPLLEHVAGELYREVEAARLGSGNTEDDRERHPEAELLRLCVSRLWAWRAERSRESAETALRRELGARTSGLGSRDRARVRDLLGTLDALRGIGGGTATELFERHRTPFARGMILFFLRDNGSDLLDYEHELLRDVDWLTAAILFGLRDGWRRLPVGLRPGRALADAVSHRMASLAHRMAESGLDLGEPPPRVKPLRELFSGAEPWGGAAEQAALFMMRSKTRSKEWACKETLVHIPPGADSKPASDGGLVFRVPHRPHMSAGVNRQKFLEHLAAVRGEGKEEAAARRKLEA